MGVTSFPKPAAPIGRFQVRMMDRIWDVCAMQGDVIGCFLHMPEGGRPMESGKEVTTGMLHILSFVLNLRLQKPQAGSPGTGTAVVRSLLIVWGSAGRLAVEEQASDSRAARAGS